MIPSMQMNVWWQYVVCVLIFGVSVFFLVKGSDIMVGGAASLAKKLKISPLVIGLTVVAIGTSCPELAVSVSDSINSLISGGNSTTALGNVIGSNIANILIVLGFSAVFTPILIKKSIMKKEMLILLGVTVLFVVFGFCFSANGQYQILRWEGGILFALCIAYLIFIVIDAKKHKNDNIDEDSGEIKEYSLGKSLLFTFIGLGMVAIGGIFSVYGAKNIATGIGVSAGLDQNLVDSLVALTVVAIGTSLPELVTSVVAAKKGQNDLALGNVIGSNIFNILLIIGVSALINPLSDGSQVAIDLLVMLGAAIVLFIVGFFKKINKFTGIGFIVLYGGYLAYLIARLFI